MEPGLSGYSMGVGWIGSVPGTEHGRYLLAGVAAGCWGRGSERLRRRGFVSSGPVGFEGRSCRDPPSDAGCFQL